MHYLKTSEYLPEEVVKRSIKYQALAAFAQLK